MTLKAQRIITLAESFGFKRKSSPNLGTYLEHSRGNLTIQENGCFSLSDDKGYGDCNAKPEFAKDHNMTVIEYGIAVLRRTLLERGYVTIHTHFIYGSGQHGCLYDNGPYAAATLQDAVDSLTNTFWLGRTRKARLLADSYLALNPSRDGAGYCEITPCHCSKPWEHNEDDAPENWPDYPNRVDVIRFQAGNDAIRELPANENSEKYLDRLSHAAIVKVWFPSGVWLELECGKIINQGEEQQ